MPLYEQYNPYIGHGFSLTQSLNEPEERVDWRIGNAPKMVTVDKRLKYTKCPITDLGTGGVVGAFVVMQADGGRTPAIEVAGDVATTVSTLYGGGLLVADRTEYDLEDYEYEPLAAVGSERHGPESIVLHQGDAYGMLNPSRDPLAVRLYYSREVVEADFRISANQRLGHELDDLASVYNPGQ